MCTSPVCEIQFLFYLFIQYPKRAIHERRRIWVVLSLLAPDKRQTWSIWFKNSTNTITHTSSLSVFTITFIQHSSIMNTLTTSFLNSVNLNSDIFLPYNYGSHSPNTNALLVICATNSIVVSDVKYAVILTRKYPNLLCLAIHIEQN